MIHIETGATDTLSAMVLYRNVMAEGALTASSEAADGAAANALGPQTYDFWTPTSVAAWLQVVTVDAVVCDACAIIAHTLGSAGATIEVQYDDGGWQTAATLTPTDDSDILILFPEAESDTWRVLITGAVASLGVVMIGPRLLIPGGVQAGYTPINLALDVQLMPSVSVAGQFLGTRVNRQGAGTTIALATQEREWVEDEAAPFIDHYNAGGTFVFASAPELMTEDIAYCWRSGGTLSASYGAGALFGDMTLEVAAYVS